MQSGGGDHSASDGGGQPPPWLPIAEIWLRAERLRLPLSRLAQDAGVAASTAAGRRVKEPRGSTERALSAALVRFELQERDYLLSLHALPVTAPPVTAPPVTEATALIPLKRKRRRPRALIKRGKRQGRGK